MFLVLLAAVAADPDPKVPVAVIGDVRGQVRVERPGSKAAAAAGGLLLAGDRVAAGEKDGLTVVLLSDGRRLRLKPGKSAAVGEKGFDPADAAEEVEGPRPPAATLRALRDAYRGRAAAGGAAVIVRGPGDEAEATRAKGASPLYKAWVLTDHPTLSWPAVAGAKEYRVDLFPGTEGATRPLWRATTADTRLPYPEEERVLEKSGKYRWRVTAVRDGKEEVAAESEFFVASDRVAEQLAAVRRLADGDDPVGWLIAADAYDAAGVYGKALPVYEKLARHAPGAANYQLALAAYYARAGRDADAKAARERAKELGAGAGGK